MGNEYTKVSKVAVNNFTGDMWFVVAYAFDKESGKKKVIFHNVSRDKKWYTEDYDNFFRLMPRKGDCPHLSKEGICLKRDIKYKEGHTHQCFVYDAESFEPVKDACYIEQHKFLERPYFESIVEIGLPEMMAGFEPEGKCFMKENIFDFVKLKNPVKVTKLDGSVEVGDVGDYVLVDPILQSMRVVSKVEFDIFFSIKKD